MALCFVLMGCVAGEGGKKNASCPQGQNFDTVSRSCKGARAEDDPPVPTFNSTSMLEDSGVTQVLLTYTDSQNDFARSCNVNAAESYGVVKQKLNQGVLYRSQNTIYDPQNTQVFIQSGSSLSVAANTSISGIRGIIITVNSSTSTLDVVTALNAHSTVSTWIQASALSFGNVSAVSGSFFLEDIPCTCTGGECYAAIEPALNYHGTTDFTYTLTDDDGTSIEKLVKVNITSVNDDPVVSSTTYTISSGVQERLPNASSPTFVFHLLNDYIVANDTADGEIDESNLSVSIVAYPTYGSLTSLGNGYFSYYTYAEQTSDSFKVKVIDNDGGSSPNVTINITNIVTVNDPPIGNTADPSIVLEDSTAQTINLTYTDEEGDLATSCVVTAVSKVYPVNGCSCVAGSCSVNIAPLPDANGAGYFKYRIYDAGGNTPAEDTVVINITSVVDSPIVFASSGGTTIQFQESDTYVPNTEPAFLDGATHGDGRSISSYTLVTAPTFGTLSGCLGQSGSGLNCYYTPADGNLADDANLFATIPSTDLPYSAATDTGTFYATTLGDTYSGLQIELINVKGTLESMYTLFNANAKAYYNNSKVTILFETGVTTATDIVNAINSNSTVEKMLVFDPSGGTQNTATTLTLNTPATNPKDFFVYRATDSNGYSQDQKVYISIIPTPDRPTVCEYSSYADTTVCGLNGCVGSAVPTSITPDAVGLVYYSVGTAACYVSNSNYEWEAVESYISDRSVNELDPVVIDNIRVDEGGGGIEDVETVSITNVDSSDTNLVPKGNIEFFYDGVSLGDATTTPISFTGIPGFDDSTDSLDTRKFKIIITPQTINPPVTEKSSEIEITVQDSNGKFTEVTFTINVQKVSATHGGWDFFAATGPKVDSLGLVNEDRDVCPYSLDMCESGQKCYGASSPINSSFADPDHADAIYLQEAGTSRTCYRMKRTQLQNIAYVGKSSNVTTIQYLDMGGTTDAAVASVTGTTITIQMNDDYTTTDSIVYQIENTPSVNALIKAINLKAGETQDATSSSTQIAALSNSNWESFETYCNATPVAFETGCNNGSRSSCVGRGAPSDASINITPTLLDSRYWDEEANVCYKSVGTSSSNDWVAYDAPAEVSISWKQFTINGSASVGEYKVFRRLANEDFDFSQPINRSTISGGSSTYTYVDNNVNSVVPPSPGTVYYYVIRPVVNGILTSTAAETGTNAIGVVRMLAPPKNMAFAHRWVINKTMCGIMNRSTDATNNYRCLYTGAGDTTVSGVQYYDFGKDLLVDRFEAGCPYSPAPNCPETYDNSCIGVADPITAGVTATTGKVYYNRNDGACYYASGGSWAVLNSANITSYLAQVEPNSGNVTSNPQFDNFSDTQYNRAGLPPLVNITQPDAHSICTGLSDIDSSDLLGISSNLAHRLPNRKDQIVYSQWDSSEYTNNEQATLETGLSLNSTSKCNSSQASGLEDGYVDIDKPDSNDFYSLPGTLASNIRSMTTGSNELATCTSKFGVQDAIGNVAEWTSHGLSCPLMATCSTNENLIIQDIEFKRVRPAGDSLNIGVTYLYNGDGDTTVVSVSSSGDIRNIEVDLDDLGSVDAATVAAAINAASLGFVTASVIGDSSNDQHIFGRTVYMGTYLTGADDTLFASSASDPFGLWTLDGKRGPCVDSNADGVCDASLSSWAFEDERHSGGRFMTPMGLVSHITSNSTFSTDYDLFEIGPTSGITALQLHDDTITVNSNVIASESSGCGKIATGGSYLSGTGSGAWNMEAVPCSNVIGGVTIQDVSYRINDSSYADIEIQYAELGVAAPTVQESSGVVIVNLSDFTPTATNVVLAVLNYFSGNEVEAFVSGVPDATQVAFSTPVAVDDMVEEGKARRTDIGFRCVLDVQSSYYDE